MIYLQLFLSFCLIGILAFGGGYAALPLIHEQCVELNKWLSMAEFSDLLTISQITPGPIAINSATFAGTKVGGITGALIASFGFMLPPFLIVTMLYFLYRKYGQMKPVQNILSGLKPAVTGLIASAAVSISVEALWGGRPVLLSTADLFSALLALSAFFVLRKWKMGVITTILACGAVGIVREIAVSLLG